jgi:fructokinase
MKICGIEAGGTKFILGIGDENGNIIHKESIPTTTPIETIDYCKAFILKHKPDALGIASFGPIDLNPQSITYGSITTTPKPGWANVPLLNEIRKIYNGPIGFDTDVNGAALGESIWGKCKDVSSCLYLTIGTGIGGGFVENNQCHHGLLHPEMGHILLRQHPKDTFKGVCPYHDNCFEGLASGPALEARYHQKANSLDHNDIAWEIEAFYIAQALVNYILILSPHRILLGGGVMHQNQLFPLIRKQVKELLNGYIQNPLIQADDESFITSPGLGDNSGLLGAFALALIEYKKDI